MLLVSTYIKYLASYNPGLRMDDVNRDKVLVRRHNVQY